MTRSPSMRLKRLASCAALGLLIQANPAHADAEVMLSLTTNVAGYPGFDRVAVLRKPIGSQKSGSGYELQPLVRGLQGDTVLLGRSLPPGDYELVQLRQTALAKHVNLNAESRRVLGRFVVADDQAIDLGRLVVTGMNELVMLGRSRDKVENVGLLRRYEPGRAADFLAAGKGQAPVAGWVSEPNEDDDVEAYAVRRPNAFHRPTEATDGRLVAASRMGTVLVRGRSGEWTRVGSRRLETLYDALPVDADGIAMVAVGEHGLLLRQGRGQPEMQVLDPGNLPKGDLTFIAGSPQLGWWVAVHFGRKIQLMKSAQLERGTWTLEREIDASPLVRDGPAGVWFWRTPEGMAYTNPRGPLALLDFMTGQWTEHRTPQGAPFMGLEVGSKGQLTALTVSSSGLGGQHALHYRSSDNGASWQRLSPPPPPTPIPYLPPPPPKPMHLLADGTLVAPGGDVSNPVLHASGDGGQTWTLRKVPTLDSVLHVMSSGLLVEVTSFAWMNVNTSKDGALSWSREYSTYDSAAYRAQKSAAEKAAAEKAAEKAAAERASAAPKADAAPNKTD